MLVRSIFRGNVRWCFPHHYVAEWDGRLGVYLQPGSCGKVTRRTPGAGYLRRWVTSAPPDDHVWHRMHVLRFVRPGDAHTVEVCWDTEWSLLGWYVNLQAPLLVHGHCLDTTDWALDVVVDPDGTWRWKDEEEFAEAIELGVFDDDAAAAAVRAEGERVIAEKPWPTGWEDWRPLSRSSRSRCLTTGKWSDRQMIVRRVRALFLRGGCMQGQTIRSDPPSRCADPTGTCAARTRGACSCRRSRIRA